MTLQSPRGSLSGLGRPSTHRLPGPVLDALSRSEPTPDAVGHLLTAERSCRLLLLRHLLRLCGERPGVFGELPGVDAMWDALDLLQRGAPDDLDAVLMHPQVGTWLAGTLRILGGTERSSLPVWAEAGQIHAVLFAVAVRSGTAMDTRIPVRDGGVFLPTLGLAVSAGPAPGIADATSSRGRTTIRIGAHVVDLPSDPSREGPGWWPLRRISVEANGDILSLWLDDIDPYRDLARAVEPARLAPDALADWSALLGDAWRLLRDRWPGYASSIAVGLTSISPLPRDPMSAGIRSASTGDAFGAAMIEKPPDATVLAVAMVHEFQHILQGGVLRMAGMVDGTDERNRYYAPWRDDPRPLGGLLQGAYAFLGMTECWHRFHVGADGVDARLFGFEFGYARRQARQGLAVLRHVAGLTAVGRRFVAGMSDHLSALEAVTLPAGIERAAWLAAASHRTTWRFRNVVVDGGSAARLARAWRDGGSPGRAQVRQRLIAADGQAPQDRLLLIKQQAAGVSPRIARRAPVADLALVSGSYDAAIAGYTDQIRADPAAHAGWSGLALALAAAGKAGWHALLRDPRVVQAVYAAARTDGADPDPVQLSVWLGDLGGAVEIAR